MMSSTDNTAPNTDDRVARFLAPETSTEQIVLFAQPYSIAASGFYFSSYEEYETKSANLRDDCGNPVEEFEIQFIDGEGGDLFGACSIAQHNLAQWFDEVDLLDDHEKIALYFLCGERNYGLTQALANLDDVCISEGTAEEAAEALFEDTIAPEIPEAYHVYFDIERFTNDLELGGDFHSFDYEGTHYTVTNANGL